VSNYTLYEKRGRRYFPVKEYDSKIMDAFPKGFALVHCQPGCTSYRYNVDPDIAGVLAACRLVEDAMSEAMRDESVWQPNKPLSKKQKETYDAFAKAMGNDIYHLSRKSAYDIVQAGIKVLVEYLKGEADASTNSTGF
jgi:hypothetical protein